MAVKRSGHARLKAALVLRDALAAELGIPLTAAMAQLRTVENNIGAAHGLTDGKYLEAIGSVCSGDAGHLSSLDSEVRQACTHVQFSPRYAQYLALMLFTHWVHAQMEDASAFLVRLNAYLEANKPKGEAVTEFVGADLQLAAFWMATAAGKTHVLHACLALLEKRRTWDRLIVVTPSESLTRQHADKLRELSTWEVFAYPMDGDASAMGRLPPDSVIVLDINKLATEKKGDGVTVPTSVFSEGRNLVFVDEGHKGQKSEASMWKALQADLAGIDAPNPKHRGLLIEFSATFGQVAEGEHAFDRYAKSVIFDYAYDRFHQDRYGKDFWHVRVQSQGDAEATAQRQTMTAALLSFWYQVSSYRANDTKSLAAELGLQVAAPLWVLLGLSVIGSQKNEGDKQQTSDVIDVLSYLSQILQTPNELAASIAQIQSAVTGGAEILADAVKKQVVGWGSEELAVRVLADCFGWQQGDKPVLRVIKAATGELGMGLLRGDTLHYYGVVNVGDASGLKRKLEECKLAVDDDVLTSSLFVRLDDANSGLNVLIGSRRFAEGWDNYRASSLTLLRLGQGEGSLIIQMFGRVVRFSGVNGNGKRLDTSNPQLTALQTAFVYGLKSAYLDAFLQGLVDNGIPEITRIECDVKKHTPKILRSIRAVAPDPKDFVVQVVGDQWLNGLNPSIVSMVASISTAKLVDGQTKGAKSTMGEDITQEFKSCVSVVDVDAIYRELVAWKRQQRWWNMIFEPVAITHALESDKYQIWGMPGGFQIRSGDDLARINRLAVTVVRRLFEGAYRKQQNKKNRYALVGSDQSGIPVKYYKDFVNAD